MEGTPRRDRVPRGGQAHAHPARQENGRRRRRPRGGSCPPRALRAARAAPSAVPGSRPPRSRSPVRRWARDQVAPRFASLRRPEGTRGRPITGRPARGAGCRAGGADPGGVGQAVREAWGLSGREEDRDPRDVCDAPGPHTGGGWRLSPAGRGVVPGEEGLLETWHPDRARFRSGRRDCHPPAPAPAATPARPCLATSCPETRTSSRERSPATEQPGGRGADNEARAPPPSAAPAGQSAPTPAGQSAPAAGLFKKRRTGAAPLSAGWIPPRM